jgi:hypothetical protein
MAAGLGFKDFATGEVLTAADVDGYLMQGIWVFASNAARDAAVTAPAEGNFAFTKDTNSLWYYDGAAWVSSGATGDIEGVTAGVGISGGGTSGTVTVTNSMATAITTAGDTLYGTGSGTFSRLGIGTAGQVLKVNSGATAPEWGAAGGSSGLTLVQRSSFSNVANTGTTFNGVFTSTYTTYLVTIEDMRAGTQADDLHMQLKYSTTTQTAGYFCATPYSTYSASSMSFANSNNASEVTIAQQTGNFGYPGFGYLWFNNVGTGNYAPNFKGQYGSGLDNAGYTLNGIVDVTNQTFTGLLFKSSSSNITGTIAIYGLATS